MFNWFCMREFMRFVGFSMDLAGNSSRAFIGNYSDLRGNPLFPAIARLRAAVARRQLWISPMFAGIA
jgi:hypothetical protein